MFTQKDYKNFIDDAGGKYQYILIHNKGAKMLGSSNSKNEAREEALENLQPYMKFVLGKLIYLQTIKVVPKKDLKSQEEVIFKILGGPIEFSLDRILIESPTRLKNTGGAPGAVNRAYITNKYLNKYKKIDERTILDFPYKFHNKLTQRFSPLDVNIYDDIYYTQIEEKNKKEKEKEEEIKKILEKRKAKHEEYEKDFIQRMNRKK
jgi:hypothetical protein